MDHICLYQLNSPCLLQAQDCLFCFPKGSNWSRLSVQTNQEIGSRAALKNGGSGSKHNIDQSLNSGRTFFKPLKKGEKNTWKDSGVWNSQIRSKKRSGYATQCTWVEMGRNLLLALQSACAALQNCSLLVGLLRAC